MKHSLKTRIIAMLRAESGAVAVEFALLAPLLFALLFGIVCVGYAIGISHSIQQLATSAARVSLEGINTTERTDLAQAYIAKAGQNYPLLNGALFDVPETVNILVTQGNAPAITVTISYPLENSMLGIANGLLGMELSKLTAGAYLAY